jgi:hypothetical protein
MAWQHLLGYVTACECLPSHCVLKLADPLLAGGGTGEMGDSKNVCDEGRPYEKNGAKGKRNLLPHFPGYRPDFQRIYERWSKPLIRYSNYGITTQFQTLYSSWRVLKDLYFTGLGCQTGA